MDLRIDMEKDIAYIKLSGKMDAPAFLDALESTVSDKRYKKGMGRLWDLTHVDLSALESKAVVELGQHLPPFPPGIGDVKVAFVAPGNVEFGLCRMFEMTCQGAAKIQVFRTMAEAEQWLKEV